jgi:hypothetical protein
MALTDAHIEIFEPRAMQHQQNRNDFAEAQAGL